MTSPELGRPLGRTPGGYAQSPSAVQACPRGQQRRGCPSTAQQVSSEPQQVYRRPSSISRPHALVPSGQQAPRPPVIVQIWPASQH
jgi:hypothetical protein